MNDKLISNTISSQIAKQCIESVGLISKALIAVFFLMVGLMEGNAQSFFSVDTIKVISKPPKDQIAVWKIEKSPSGRPVATEFIECIEVTVSTKENIASKSTFAKAYYFDRSGKLIVSHDKPAKSGPKNNPRAHYTTPVIFNSGKKERIFFPTPPKMRRDQWQVVVVFGDKHEARAMTYPIGSSYSSLEFPEKALTLDNTLNRVKRKPVADQVIEYVVKTRNPKHPQITLFLRPPKGISDWSEVKGVYALVVLANSVEDIRRRMQAVELDGDEAGSFAFANRHKLAILVWGSRRIWNPRMNFDDYNRQEARELDRSFDLVANAWERAVQHFHKEYGLPTNQFILKGSCGAAQWAKRLCLRKPDYFLAAHIHLAGSYDKPTPEAAKVLWCVTTTEVDGGYERSKHFFLACREAGYPILYKAYMPQSRGSNLGAQFFEYAMTVKEKRIAYEQSLDALGQRPSLRSKQEHPKPWLETFVNPPFYGDIVNQELFPAKEKEMIPDGFRSPIPTEKLAKIWKGN